MRQPVNNQRYIVSNVCASMRAEGFQVTAATQKKCEEIASGQKTADALIEQRLASYRKHERV